MMVIVFKTFGACRHGLSSMNQEYDFRDSESHRPWELGAINIVPLYRESHCGDDRLAHLCLEVEVIRVNHP
jgi:hypothetical protein